jgi:hypothetical protein
MKIAYCGAIDVIDCLVTISIDLIEVICTVAYGSLEEADRFERGQAIRTRIPKFLTSLFQNKL